MKLSKIIISRTDKIGDVILTLPMTGIIKEHYPDCKIFFLGEAYTKSIVESCEYVDEFINWSELKKKNQNEQVTEIKKLNADALIHVFPNKEVASLAKKANIPLRIGTGHRLYHLTKCNKLLFFSRKNSDLHESQLNLKLLKPIGINQILSKEDLSGYYGFTKMPSLKNEYKQFLDNNKINLILHPKSKGSAREWGLSNFGKLIELLPREKYHILISGTLDDRTELREFIDKYSGSVTDITGKMNLEQFIAFIKNSDALVAASTGPLHIASASGITAIGIFPPIRPMHPGRWGPIGRNAHYLVLNKECSKCRKTLDCECIRSVKPEEVVRKLEENFPEDG